MAKTSKHIFDKPVTLYCYDEDIDDYAPVEGIPTLHAHINTAYLVTEKYEGKAEQYNMPINVYFRYSSTMLYVALHPQLYRLKYNGDYYDVIGGDDYQMQHREVMLRAVIINGGR